MKTALVVEDNENNLELITFILHAGGYATRGAITGLDGVAEALRERPDFILLDIQLPDIDGLEVARRIRAGETGAPIPMIAITSFAMAGDRERVLAAGCNGYIEKPVDPLRVMAQIEDVLLQAC
ncbi:response regulator [Methyloversatilis sp.]|uniref:response regulator n=1 Tax=Methyloversatilis sp. TaxID=2569862 RepID=UPI0027375914|nr:response regulator [Methyloversatilis sp.]MDP2870430.1 response regulator [Methyloversatilis sp.]MDP3457251.1 response regulator [Methyloversatilis sp.]MDP3576643.1 response regulator [Methyloversatilis sp.]